MATVLQWQSHITDSTDRETILGNIDILEQFAVAINGGDEFALGKEKKTLSSEFKSLRTNIKNGSIKPTEWKTSQQIVNVTKALTNASSSKIEGIGGRLTTAEEALKEKLGSSDFEDFKVSEFKTVSESVKSHGEALGEQKQTLAEQEQTLAGQGERLNTAEKAIEKKLESSTFENFKVGDFKTITDWKSSMEEKVGSFASSAELESLKTLLNNEVSHWTSDTTPAPQSYTATAKVKASKQPWGTNEDPERHVGDLCTVIGADEKDKGVSYRFIKDPSADSYKWLKVIDNDGILALKMHNKFIKTYTERQAAIDTDSKNQQNALDALKKRLGLSDDTLENLKSKVKAQSNTIDEQQHTIDEMRNQYKVTVTTRGSIRNGEIVDGVPRNGYPAILHTAHVYDTAGKEISDIDTLNKLVWTVNKGRTTAPLQFVVPGATCYVTEKDLVKSPDNPNYYDIELNSNF